MKEETTYEIMCSLEDYIEMDVETRGCEYVI
jgi:hypothetical protein